MNPFESCTRAMLWRGLVAVAVCMLQRFIIARLACSTGNAFGHESDRITSHRR